MVVILKKGTTKKSMERLLTRLRQKKRTKGIDAYKYCGVLTLRDDALNIQKKMRDEWK